MKELLMKQAQLNAALDLDKHQAQVVAELPDTTKKAFGFCYDSVRKPDLRGTSVAVGSVCPCNIGIATTLPLRPAPAAAGFFLAPLRGCARSPYWSPGEELTNEAEARSIVESVFPGQPHEPPFFTQTPRKIFAQMLRRIKARSPADRSSNWEAI